ncbi:CPBP family intramembrane metalloprotease [bacterium]|nr:CPBP family intramembrane metalloprotease [bacterium]
MKNLLPQTALRITTALIVLVWLFDFINTFFGTGSVYKILDPNISVNENLPKASIYIIAFGIVNFLIALFLLHMSGEGLNDLGFKKERLLGQFGKGALFGVLIFILTTFLVNPVVEAIFPKSESDSIVKLFTTPGNIVLLAFLSVFKGGFLEEFFRIFELTRFEKTFGKIGLMIALVGSSATFGLGHAYQGTSGIFSAAITGFLFALTYLRKRSAVEAISAHAAFDLIALILGCLLYYGGQ